MIARALFFVIYNSFKNRLLMRIRRMREPRYLIGGIAGAFYLYFYIFRFLHRAGGGGPPAAQRAIVESVYALVFFIALLLTWILPHSRAALTFTEAEVAFLFPAPIGRQELLNFKLLRQQVRVFFSGFFIAVVGRFGSGLFFGRWIGWWIVMSAFNLHLIGSSFSITMMMDRGISNWRRRALFLGAIVLGIVGIGWWVVAAFPAPPTIEAGPGALSTIKNYLDHALQSGPLPYLLWPCKTLVAPFLSRTPEAFFRALPGALGLVALHYVWVMRSTVAFEEASIDVSRKAADRTAAIRAGTWRGSSKPRAASRSPFRLASTGFPAVALVWKNIIAAGHVMTVRFWILLAWVVLVSGLIFHSHMHSGVEEALTVMFCFLLGFSVLLGPNLLRNDLRQDLPVTDMLKVLPLPGWQVVLGEVLAPVSILVGGQWLLMLMALLCCPDHWDQRPFPLLTRLGIFFGTALVLPAIDFAGLLIRNICVVIFPAWFQLGRDGARGFENTGQQLVLLLGQTLALALALLPPAVAALAVWFAVMLLYGPALATVAAALAALGIVVFEAVLALRWIGSVFERFDLSKELPAAG